MKNFAINIFFLIITLSLFAQNDSIKAENLRMYAFRIDRAEIKSQKAFKVKFDSIDVNVLKFENKIETDNLFKRTKNYVSLKLYFTNDELAVVVVKQFSESSKEFWLESSFYFANEKVFYLEEESFGQSAAMHGIPFRPKPKSELFKDYGYNEKINTEFLKFYIFELIKKIKNHS